MWGMGAGERVGGGTTFVLNGELERQTRVEETLSERALSNRHWTA